MKLKKNDIVMIKGHIKYGGCLIFMDTTSGFYLVEIFDHFIKTVSAKNLIKVGNLDE